MARYDRAITVFSPDGHLFQVEYAIEAIKLGTTAVGIRTSEGVVLAVEKRLTSKLVESTSIEKIWEIDSHIGCAVSGLTADARQLVDHARVEAQNHRFTYVNAEGHEGAGYWAGDACPSLPGCVTIRGDSVTVNVKSILLTRTFRRPHLPCNCFAWDYFLPALQISLD